MSHEQAQAQASALLCSRDIAKVKKMQEYMGELPPCKASPLSLLSRITRLSLTGPLSRIQLTDILSLADLAHRTIDDTTAKAHAKAQEAKAARAAKASKGKGTKVKPPTRKTRSALSATTTAPAAEGLEL